MPDGNAFALFLAAALVLLLTPGPAVLFIVTRSVQQGRLAGVVATLGLCSGGLVHLLAAVLGLSAIVATSAAAFSAVKLAGAGYLVWLGIKALRSRRLPMWTDAQLPRAPLRRQFADGLVVNLLNPKPAIFFIAFLPQFVDPARGSVRAQLLVLGLTFLAMALVTDGGYGLLAGSARSWLLRQPRILRWEPYVSAAVYFGLGVSAALTGRRAS
jgi:threonine/homoserine/homoserine lactone efflux protein